MHRALCHRLLLPCTTLLLSACAQAPSGVPLADDTGHEVSLTTHEPGSEGTADPGYPEPLSSPEPQDAIDGDDDGWVDLPAGTIGSFCFAPGSDDLLFELRTVAPPGDRELQVDTSVYRARVDETGQPTGEALRFADLSDRHSALPGPVFVTGLACNDAASEVLAQVRYPDALAQDAEPGPAQDAELRHALWWLDAEGQTVVHPALPVGPIFAELDPWWFAWSPEGREVLLQSAGGSLTLAGLPASAEASRWSFDLGLTLYRPAGAGGGRMSWSSDGRQILLQSSDALGADLSVARVEARAVPSELPIRTLRVEGGWVTPVEGVQAGRVEYLRQPRDERYELTGEIELWSAVVGAAAAGGFEAPVLIGSFRLPGPDDAGLWQALRLSSGRYALRTDLGLFLLELGAGAAARPLLWRASREGEKVDAIVWSPEREALAYRVSLPEPPRPAYPGARDDHLDLRQLRVLRLPAERLDAIFEAEASPSGASPSGLPEGWIRHVDEREGWVIDLPPDWRFEEQGRVTMLYSFPEPAAGRGGIDPAEAKIDIYRVERYSGALEGLVAHIDRQRAEEASDVVVLSEEPWSLADGTPALRRELDSEMAGVVHTLVFSLDGRGYRAVGFGDGAAFDAVMRTLRPLP